MLKNIKEKNTKLFGVKVNKEEKKIAKTNGVKVFSNSSLLRANYFDLIISNHALEHTDNPLLELKNLHKASKIDVQICIVVPLDSKSYSYKKMI